LVDRRRNINAGPIPRSPDSLKPIAGVSQQEAGMLAQRGSWRPSPLRCDSSIRRGDLGVTTFNFRHGAANTIFGVKAERAL